MWKNAKSPVKAKAVSGEVDENSIFRLCNPDGIRRNGKRSIRRSFARQNGGT